YLCTSLATDGLALLLAWLIWRHSGSLLPALLPLLGVALGRLLFIRRGFRSSHRLCPPQLAAAYPQTGGARRSTMLRETLAMWRMFGWLMPLPLCTRRKGRGTPIVFVHGFICNAGVWQPMMRWLARHSGTSMRAISLYPVLGDIDDYAAQLQRAVGDLCQRSGETRVMLVGHSMGGLVIRRYLRRFGSAQVARVVTIGSPHHGVFIPAKMARRGRNLAQMKHGSAWLAELGKDEAGAEVPLLSIWSPHDNVCAPQDTSRLAHARELIVPNEGHDTLLYTPPVWNAVLEEWRAC
ncbi:MAG: esterase/lipase family protein, partial [Stenotrophobium sp.]